MAESTDPELDWRNYLNPKHYDVPLHALRYTCCKRLVLYLEQEQEEHDGIVPDFGGLAELIGFDGLEISGIERSPNPGKKVLDDWKQRPDLNPTVGRFMEFLSRLGRVDILTDCAELIRSDVLAFLDKPKQFIEMTKPVQDETVSQGPGMEENLHFVTRHDVMTNTVTLYDAFICFNPLGESSKDLEFVKELAKRFESPPFNFNLFIPYRDDLAGLNEHTVNAKIISERCRHMIVVLSKNFLQSPACEFQSSFAHSLSPGARNKRIVPIRIDDCATPNILRIMACCDFTKRELWDWSWDRLARSIKTHLNASDFEVDSSRTMDKKGVFDVPPSMLPLSTLASPSSSSSSQSVSSSSTGRKVGRFVSSADSAYDSIGYAELPSPSSCCDRPSPSATTSASSKTMTQSSSSRQCNAVDSGLPSPMETESSPQRRSHQEEKQQQHQQQVSPAQSEGREGKRGHNSPSLGSRALKRLTDTFSSSGKKSNAKTKQKTPTPAS